MIGPGIRDACEADLPAILAITNHAILGSTALWTLTPTTLEDRRGWWQQRLAGGFPVLVAARGPEVLGFASYGPFRPHEGYALTVEHSLYVREASRGQGIGRLLLAALVEHARASGKHVMVGGIEASNQASIRLHERAGFNRAAMLPEVGRKFDRWLDLLFVYNRL